MRLIVLGASGLVGREVVRAAQRRGHQVTALGGNRLPTGLNLAHRSQIDLTQLEGLERLLLDSFPDAVINAAALSDVSACERQPELARQLNAALPHRLAQITNHLGARLIHLSTDMVFDGEKGSYRSTDTPAPLNTYALTKLEGEKAVLAAAGHGACVLRSTPVLGNTPAGDRTPHERFFMDWRQGKVAGLFQEEIRQPVSVTNLADVCIELAERSTLSGIFHWAGLDALSRFELGRRIASHFGLNPEDTIRSISYQDVPNLPRRPRDLSVELHPLVGKIRTRPQTLEEIIAELEVPVGSETWWRAQTGREVVRRLTQGLDF